MKTLPLMLVLISLTVASTCRSALANPPCLKTFFDAPHSGRKFGSNDHLELSRYWSTRQKPVLALEEATEALNMDKSNDYCYFFRACRLSDMKRYREALKDMNRAISLAPDFGAYYRVRALMKSQLHDKEGAIADYTDALAIDPKDAEALDGRGNIRSEINDKEGAIKDFELGLTLAPKNIACNFDYACEMLSKQDYSKAIEKLSVVNKAEPNEQAYFLRAFANFKLNKYAAAIDDLDAAIAMRPNMASYYFLRMKCKFYQADLIGAACDLYFGTGHMSFSRLDNVLIRPPLSRHQS